MFGLFLFWIFSFKDVQPGLFFIRIFRVLNTVQSFIFKVHLVVSLSAATLIVYHSFKLLSTTFLNFFLNLFRFALLFSAACYILSDVHAFVNNFLFFLFTLTLFFAGELYYIILLLVCQRFFQILSYFIVKKELQMQECIQSPFSTLFSLTKNHLKCEWTTS